MELTKLSHIPLLVIVGSWQAEVFSRPFICNELFSGETPIIEDLPNIPNVSMAFGLEDYRIQVQNDRICFIVIKHSLGIEQEILKRAEMILTLLPFTPVRAFGINWHFKLTGISSGISDKFRIFTDDLYSKGYFLQGVSSIFKLTKENYALNIVLQTAGIECIAEINFDYQVIDTRTIRNLLTAGRMLNHEKEASDLLKEQLS